MWSETSVLINKPESTGWKHCNDFKAFIEYSNDMDNICKNIDKCIPIEKKKKLIVFDDVIADILNKKTILIQS